jgi:hypothetical protein
MARGGSGDRHTERFNLGSCETTTTSSRVTATSNSSASAPTEIAYSNPGSVFSGRMARAPRWP